MTELVPELTERQLTEKLADFFSSISQEFQPLETKQIPETHWKEQVPIETHQIAARLKMCKKPKSTVRGDIFPELISKHYDLLAIPLTPIFNMVKTSHIWPKLWKTETTTVIPKNDNADSYGDCRNLSCTPLLSLIHI